MNQRPKTLLYGGVFNPITSAHILCAEFAKDAGNFAEVVFIPCGDAPHKKNLIPFCHRENMVKAETLMRHDSMGWSDIEFRWANVGKKSYTINTWRYFVKEDPNREHLWLIGGDTVPQLPTWYNFASIQKEMKFAVMPRRGYERYAMESLLTAMGVQWEWLDIPVIEISSTMVRERIASGKSIDLLVPRRTQVYIEEHKLYKGVAPSLV